jgi:DNA-binding transcriptional LysR family regulator
VNASRKGLDFTPIDTELEKLKLRRTIALVVPSFYAALVVASRSELLATIPQLLVGAAESFSLRSFKLPVPLTPIDILQSWHPRFEHDTAHSYLRECVREVCKASGRAAQTQSP